MIESAPNPKKYPMRPCPPDSYAPQGPDKRCFLDLLALLGHAVSGKECYKPEVMELAQTLLEGMEVLTITDPSSDREFVQGVGTFLPFFRNQLVRIENELHAMKQHDLEKGSRTRDIAAENAAIVLRQLVPIMENIASCFSGKNAIRLQDGIGIATPPEQPKPARRPIIVRIPGTPFEAILGGRGRPAEHRLDAVMAEIDTPDSPNSRRPAI